MWAIQQLFPILPIHRLDEQPTVSAILADLTCGESSKLSPAHHPGIRQNTGCHAYVANLPL